MIKKRKKEKTFFLGNRPHIEEELPTVETLKSMQNEPPITKSEPHPQSAGFKI